MKKNLHSKIVKLINYYYYVRIAKEEDLVKIHHVSLDGTKIKAKTSMNKLTNEQQLKIMKQHHRY